MKKTILALAALILSSQAALAADIYCGANKETVPGTQIYNKLVFWEKMDTTKPLLIFVMEDGSILKTQQFTPEKLAQIKNNDLAMSISFSEGRPQLFSGLVQRNDKNEIAFTSSAIASSLTGHDVLLIANNISVVCKEL